jgi:hypothetical protein
MKNLKANSSPKKNGRSRYFELEIHVGILGSQSRFLLNHPKILIACLKIFGFPSQSRLEKTLYDLKIFVKEKRIQLTNFMAQLEFPPGNGLPYWKISLETNRLTTGLTILRALSAGLNPNNNTEVNREIFQIKSTEEFLELQQKKIGGILGEEWSPGYFDREEIYINELISKRQMKKQKLVTESDSIFSRV